jgi:hypothetical protein
VLFSILIGRDCGRERTPRCKVERVEGSVYLNPARNFWRPLYERPYTQPAAVRIVRVISSALVSALQHPVLHENAR